MPTLLTFQTPAAGGCTCHVEVELRTAATGEPALSVRVDAATGSAIVAERAGCPSPQAAFIDLLHVAIQSMGGRLEGLVLEDEECQQAWLRVAMPAKTGALGPVPPGVGLLVAARRALPVYHAGRGERLAPLTHSEVPEAFAGFLQTVDFSVLAPGEPAG